MIFEGLVFFVNPVVVIKIKKAEFSAVKLIYQNERPDMNAAAIFERIAKRFTNVRRAQNFENVSFYSLKKSGVFALTPSKRILNLV